VALGDVTEPTNNMLSMAGVTLSWLMC